MSRTRIEDSERVVKVEQAQGRLTRVFPPSSPLLPKKTHIEIAQNELGGVYPGPAVRISQAGPKRKNKLEKRVAVAPTWAREKLEV